MSVQNPNSIQTQNPPGSPGIFSDIFNKAKRGVADVANYFTPKKDSQQPQMQTTMGGKKKKRKTLKRKFRKGSRSKTRRGRKDFITHKGSKKYNRKGHRQSRNSKGRKGKPYSKRQRKGGNPFIIP